MKVFSLYYNDEFVASFPTKESAIFYGKQFYEDAWDCNIIEEYLHKSPLTYTPPPYTTLTPQQTIPCNPGITLLPGTPKTNPSINPITDKPPYPANPNVWCGTPQINNTVRAK
jgi:hypothetical protein